LVSNHLDELPQQGSSSDVTQDLKKVTLTSECSPLVIAYIKGLVHCFSMQVVMNKCFLLNPEKKFGADPSCGFQERWLEGEATLITS